MKIERYVNDNNDVLFRLTNNVRYYYKLHRAKNGKEITYICFNKDEVFYEKSISHIDDFYAWFFISNTEKVVERLYEKAHNMAKTAIINAYVNGN